MISSKAEHHAVLNAFEYLEGRENFEVTWLDVSRDGLVDLDHLARAIRPETRLVSIMAANNEIGVINPCRRCRCLGRIDRGVHLRNRGVELGFVVLIPVGALAGEALYRLDGIFRGGIDGEVGAELRHLDAEPRQPRKGGKPERPSLPSHLQGGIGAYASRLCGSTSDQARPERTQTEQHRDRSDLCGRF